MAKHKHFMGLIRILTYLAIGWLIWRTLKVWYKGFQETSARQPPKPKKISSKIVKCEYCELHLPETEALQYEGHWYCSAAHKQACLKSS